MLPRGATFPLVPYQLPRQHTIKKLYFNEFNWNKFILNLGKFRKNVEKSLKLEISYLLKYNSKLM